MRIAWVLVLTLVLGVGGVAAKEPFRGEGDLPWRPGFFTGEVWTELDSLPDPALLAEVCAPVLWFAPFEPLASKYTNSYPSPLPMDHRSEPRVVYYQGKGFETAHQTGEFSISYLIYYPYDEGFGGHKHDLERTTFYFRWGHRSIELVKVVADAHGIAWFENELVIEGRTSFPITLLVEQGKHASCPDRDANGIFTPGFDVNRSLNDAWGIRDTLSQGSLLAAKYASHMGVQRRGDARDLLYPEGFGEQDVNGAFDGPRFDPAVHRTYVLSELPAPETIRDWEACDDPWAKRLKENLLQYSPEPGSGAVIGVTLRIADLMLAYPRLIFGNYSGKKRYWPLVESTADLGIPKKSVAWFFLVPYYVVAPTVSYRYDEGNGLAAVFSNLHFPLPGINGLVVPKVALTGDHRSAGLLYANSASRWLDWYANPTYNAELRNGDDKHGFDLEAGLKFRFPATFLPRDPFVGFRTGVRLSGFPEVDSARFVCEVGAGVF